MQMIMFFVDSDQQGGTHITRTVKAGERTEPRTTESRRARMGLDRLAGDEAEVVIVASDRDRFTAHRLTQIDRAPEPQPVFVDEEEIERWDGLY
jgi:hypothetical protein